MSTAADPAIIDRRRHGALRGLTEPSAATGYLIPEGMTGVPKPLAEANDRALGRLEKWQAAKADADTARQEMESAPSADDAADRAAAKAGEDMPERTEPARRAAFALANRAEQAAGEIAREAVLDLFAAFAEHREAWLTKLEPALEKERAELRTDLDALPGRWRSLQARASVCRAVAGYEGEGHPDPLFDLPGRSGPRLARFEAKLQHELEVGMRHMVPRDVEYLIEALRQLTREET